MTHQLSVARITETDSFIHVTLGNIMLDLGPTWNGLTTQEQTLVLNHTLMPYGGQVVKQKGDRGQLHMWFEFDHESDLTAFVITWS